METENLQLQKLNDIVRTAIEEEKPITTKLYTFENKQLTLKSKVTDTIADFGGSRVLIFFLLNYNGHLDIGQ